MIQTNHVHMIEMIIEINVHLFFYVCVSNRHFMSWVKNSTDDFN